MTSKVKYPYTRAHHFRYKLQQITGEDTTEIPNELINKILSDMKDRKVIHPTISDIKMSIRNHAMDYYEHASTIYQKIYNNHSTNNILKQENSDKDFECPVCLQTDIKTISKLDCNHTFCDSCITIMTVNNKIRCPLCRKEYITKIIAGANNNNLTDDQIFKLMESFEQVLNKFDKWNKTLEQKENFPNYNYIIKKLAEMHGIKLDIDDIKSYEKKKAYDKMWNEILNHQYADKNEDNKSNNKSNNTVCNSCPLSKVVHDMEYGMLVCTNCGNIVKNVYSQ